MKKGTPAIITGYFLIFATLLFMQLVHFWLTWVMCIPVFYIALNLIEAGSILNKKGRPEAPKQEQQQAVNTTPAAGAALYPSIALDTLEMLWSKCNYIDFVFYNLNFSVSQNDPPAIKSTIQHVAADVPAINNACKPEGRIFFQVDGRNALEGDFYLGKDCIYYIWY